jgi:hypothetical protein
MSLGNSPDIQARSGEVATGIESLLAGLGAGTPPSKGMPAGIISLEEAPASTPTIIEEPTPAEEPVAEEPAQAEEPVLDAEEVGASEPIDEIPSEETSTESGDEGEDDDEEEEEEDE